MVNPLAVTVYLQRQHVKLGNRGYSTTTEAELKYINLRGHTLQVSMEHYLNLPFLDSDKQLMKSYVDGWL